MIINALEVLNFRNLLHIEMEQLKGINIIIGTNGSGKTNILEAIHYLALTKSCFGHSDRQNVTHNNTFFLIKGLSTSQSPHDLELTCSYTLKEGKSFKMNNKVYSKLSDHIGFLPMVMVAPQDYRLVEDGGEEQRRFLNTALSQVDKSYLETLMAHNNLLINRNTYLRSTSNIDTNVIEAIDFKLLHYIRKIYEIRSQFVDLLQAQIGEYYHRITQSEAEKASIVYYSHLQSDNFEQEYRSRLQRDIIMKHTTMGIHRDRLEFLLDSLPIRRYGSQGQQKSYLLSLRLAQNKVLHEQFEKKAILLFDDLFDKLDLERSKNLFDIILQLPHQQIFITESNIDRIAKLRLDKESGVNIVSLSRGTIIQNT